jgi:hypothetical protein
MIEKLKVIQQRFDEVSDLIIQPQIIADQKRYIQLNKEYKDLSELVSKMNQYQNLLSNIEEAELMLKQETDQEMLEMARFELDQSKEELPKIEEQIKMMLIPKNPEEGFLGGKLYNNWERGLYRTHKTVGNITTLSYFTGAGLSLFSPPPLTNKKYKGLNSIKAHKYLASIHFSAMVATGIYKNRNKKIHKYSAYTAVGSFAAAVLVFKF